MSGFEKESELKPLGFTEDDLESIGEFKFSIVTLLTSLLEGEIDQSIISRMANSLDFNHMKNRLLVVFWRFAENILDKKFPTIKSIPIS